MRIIGIDPGSRVTGYGVVDVLDMKLVFVACGVIKTNTKYQFSQRLDQIFDGINEVVSLHNPDVGAVEDIFLATNPGTALKLGQARGAAVVALTQNALQVFDYTAKKVKRSVVGYGQAEKSQMQHMVKALLSLSAAPSSDAADALAVAICHANSYKFLKT